MNKDLDIKVPFFTDFTTGAYLKQVLNEVKENTVIALEYYHELKDLLLQCLKQEINYEKFSNACLNRMQEIDPELKKEPNYKIKPTFEYIIKSLSGKKFLAIETLEDYDFDTRSLDERNEIIYTNLGNVINKYINQAESIILLATNGHSMPIIVNNQEDNEFNINKYVKYKLKNIKKIENENQSFIISYSRNQQSF